jgi:glycosyltransferase involved in cell wall biosynthesis
LVALSVVLPVRDGQEFLEAALASLRAQTFADFELLVIDDGSRDATLSIASRHAAEDPRVKVLHNPGKGLVDALNFGLNKARAEIVARMDADDIALPTRFERQLEHWAGEPGLLALGTATVRIDGNGTRFETIVPPTRPQAVAEALMRVNVVAHPSVIMDRSAVLAAGGYRPAYLLAEDYDLWLRLAEKGPLANLPEPLLEYRVAPRRFDAARFARQILSETAARAAAALRRKGRRDPTSDWLDIEPGMLALLDMDPSRLCSETARRALQAARQFRRGGQREACREALRLAAIQPRQGAADHLRYAARLAKVYL